MGQPVGRKRECDVRCDRNASPHYACLNARSAIIAWSDVFASVIARYALQLPSICLLRIASRLSAGFDQDCSQAVFRRGQHILVELMNQIEDDGMDIGVVSNRGTITRFAGAKNPACSA